MNYKFRNYDTDSKEKINQIDNANKSVSDDSEKKPVDNINKDTSNKILQVDEGNQDIFRFTQNPNFIQYSIQSIYLILRCIGKFDTGDTIQEAAGILDYIISIHRREKWKRRKHVSDREF